jgi:6-phospho-3-hexuloisomerase
LIEAIVTAKRIALYGVGREGLMMKSLAMRLFHLGLEAHVVGDMTTPPVGADDLLIVSAGPGDFSTVSALLGVARRAGATTACITAHPQGEAAKAADIILHLPAQTMADDPAMQDPTSGQFSILPMGSLYEGVQYLVFELMILRLRDRLGRTSGTMRANHTNLE